MTVATAHSAEFRELAKFFEVEFDEIGELTNSGRLEVHYNGEKLVDMSLEFLHKGCPQLSLQTSWTFDKEKDAVELQDALLPLREPDLIEDFPKMLQTVHLGSREGIVRRFDHEVQGRSVRKPFAGRLQESPQDGSALEIYESETPACVVLSHGLAPWRKSIEDNVLASFDEAIRTGLLAGARFETAGLLDNFCWSDPLKSDRRLWRLVRACETLSALYPVFEMPLVSGKDSMKNNSKDFEVLQTLVVSLGASSRPRSQVPAGFFSRANDVLFHLPLLQTSLRDSAWERCFRSRAPDSDRPELIPGNTAQQKQERTVFLARELKARYEKVSKAMERGLIRSAADVSEGGLLMTAFEMGLGRDLGVAFEETSGRSLLWLGEGVGGLLLALDPHHARELQQVLPDARRLGVVVKAPVLRFQDGAELSTSSLRENYGRLNAEKFWG